MAHRFTGEGGGAQWGAQEYLTYDDMREFGECGSGGGSGDGSDGGGFHSSARVDGHQHLGGVFGGAGDSSGGEIFSASALGAGGAIVSFGGGELLVEVVFHGVGDDRVTVTGRHSTVTAAAGSSTAATGEEALLLNCDDAELLSSHPLNPPGCVPLSASCRPSSNPEVTLRSSTLSSLHSPPLPLTPRPPNQPRLAAQPLSPPPPRALHVPRHITDAANGRCSGGRYGDVVDSPLGTHEASMQLLSESPLLLVFDNFLSPAECDDLMAIASPELRRSRVTDGKLSDGRTSSSTFLTGARQEEPLVSPRISTPKPRTLNRKL